MMKQALLISMSAFLLTLPITALAANLPANVYENGTNNNPIAVSDVKVEVFGGYGFMALFSSAMTGTDGGCILKNVPLGKEVLVRLTKPGYITQYDIRSYSEADAEKDVILWIGSESNVKGLYSKLGETFDVKKGQVYLEISNEMTGEGIEGIQLVASSGKVFDLGQGEYLIANAEGASVQIMIGKPGYAFDVESATIPLYAGAMTQYYVNVQSGGAVYESGSVMAVTPVSVCITGYIKRLSDSGPISGVSIAFTRGGPTVAPSVTTNSAGFYKQCGFESLVKKNVRVTPKKSPWKFKPTYRVVHITATGAIAPDIKGR
jgi:hypothetical protein